MSDICICCGEPIPEGRWVCFNCVNFGGPDGYLPDGTSVEIKVPVKACWPQLQLYAELNKSSLKERKTL